jgi:hypothetical protein
VTKYTLSDFNFRPHTEDNFLFDIHWIKAWNKNLIPGMWCNLGNGEMSFVDVSVQILGLTRPKSNDRGNPMPQDKAKLCHQFSQY